MVLNNSSLTEPGAGCQFHTSQKPRPPRVIGLHGTTRKSTRGVRNGRRPPAREVDVASELPDPATASGAP